MKTVLASGSCSPCEHRLPRQSQMMTRSRYLSYHSQSGWRRVYARASNEDVELAVFRFTLGIPGFDDALIPRVVGVVGACLLVANHIISGESSGPSQTVTEVLGMVLAGVGIVAPTLQRTIEESTPGKGRRAPVEDLEGSSNVFAISESMSEAQKEEAAWASFAVLKNANVCGMCLYIRGEMVLCRGALGVAIQGKDCLNLALKEYKRMGIEEASHFRYLQSKAEISSSKYSTCGIVPSGAGGVVQIPVSPLQTLADGTLPDVGCMLLVCDRERAMSAKELAWCKSVASKLYFAFELNSIE
mmetsp:Transcript_12653/g.25401  ORF Transcript_12653/g.25401 Transcript_12653/m.25401 type:complete len:301 (-) Transcript_12653:1512-2414(-)